MLKITYTEIGHHLEYCPEPLDLLLSDRVCLYAHTQRPILISPLTASFLLPRALGSFQELARFPEVELTICDRHWVEVTLRGLWITEAPQQAVGVFLTELDPRLEQRLFRLWQLSRPLSEASAHARQRP